MRASTIAFSLISIVGMTTAATAQGDKDGQGAFNSNCRQCHVVKQGDNRLGPSLAGVVGNKSGQSAGFGYSSGLKDGAITWDEATLDKWIENPDSVSPSHNMKPYAGIDDPALRKTIISYLAAAGDGGGGDKPAGAAGGENPAGQPPAAAGAKPAETPEGSATPAPAQ